MENIQHFKLNQDLLNINCEYILIVLFDIGFYCDIFANIHAGIYCNYYSCNINCSVLW